MQFELDEEQIEIRDTVRRFTEQEITLYAGDWDEQDYFPREVFTRMAGLGLLGMTCPEEDGGARLAACQPHWSTKNLRGAIWGLLWGLVCIIWWLARWRVLAVKNNVHAGSQG